MNDKRIIQDVYALMAYFGAETKATHDELITRVTDLEKHWPGGGGHFKGLVDACLSVFINKDDPTDMSSQAGHLEAYFNGKAHRDGVWKRKLEQLAATDPTVADAINTLTDAVVTVWEDQAR